ncbi:serine nek11 threonine-protein kinase, partial [Mytilus galloprovincialis]
MSLKRYQYSLDSGVLCGTVLGPLLFLAYVNDKPETTTSPENKLFADDSLLYKTISSQAESDLLHKDLTSLENLINKWQISFNAKKCIVIKNRPRLGKGNFGTAFLVRDRRLKTRVAEGESDLKVLKEISVGELAPDETVDAVSEAKVLSKLNHPGIVKFHDSFIDGESFCIVTEYCEGGDLDAKINELAKSKKSLEEKTILDWFVQLVLAVHYMHTRRILHRDLKSRNIFLKGNMVKIGDFGISKILMGT